MSNEATITRGRKPRGAVAAACALGLILSGSCSTVFTASISGSIIDGEDYDDGVTTGVSDARVYLYIDEDAWDEDYAGYVEGDEATLPDGGPDVLYFQSTETDADGAYQFSGFIWETITPEYGKTADRREVYLLVYHRDYGLWKSVLPLFVVSDVTAQLPDLRIEDRYNEGTITGTVVDWADGDGLEGVTVGFYVAKSWTYDSGGAFADVVYDDAPSATATTDADGYWSADVAFPMEPDRATHASHNDAPVRVTFSRTDYRANDPEDGTDLDTINTVLVKNVDLDGDGKTAAQGDYSDAYAQRTLEMATTVATMPDVTMQRWNFSVRVQGRIKDTSDVSYINGAKITLGIPDASGRIYSDYSESIISGDIELKGSFDLGTITWSLSDIPDSGTNRQDGRVAVALSATPSGSAENPAPSGDIASLEPDSTVVLELTVP